MKPVLAALAASRRHLGVLLILALAASLLSLVLAWLRTLLLGQVLLPLLPELGLQEWQVPVLVLTDLAFALLLALPAALAAWAWLPRLLPPGPGRRLLPTFRALVLLKLALWLFALCLSQWLRFPNGLAVALPVAVWGQGIDPLDTFVKGFAAELIRIALTAAFLGGILRRALDWPGRQQGAEEWRGLVVLQLPFVLVESLLIFGLWSLVWSGLLPPQVAVLSWPPVLAGGLITMVSFLLQLTAAGFLLRQRQS